MITSISCTVFNNSDSSFNKNEKNELDKLINYFENTIENEGDPYYYMVNRLNSTEDESEFLEKVLLPQDSIEKILKIAQKMDVFHEIWVCNYGVSDSNRSDTTYYLFYNQNGKFIKYLEKVANKNKLYNDYHRIILQWGGMIPPALMGGFHNGFKETNDGSFKYKLLFVIHYLTVNFELYAEEKKIKMPCKE